MKEKPEYRTPSGRLAPYPNMTDDELDDFEDWADEVTPKRYLPVGCFTVVAVWIAALLLIAGLYHPPTFHCKEFPFSLCNLSRSAP